MSDETERGDGPETGYDAWLDALAAGEGFALVCPNGHGSLPPRRVCPECGATDRSREPLAETGTVETHSVVHVPAADFAADAPYATAVVDLGPTRVTGIYRDAGDAAPAPRVGERVAVGVAERETDGERLVVFRPVDDA